MRFFFMYYQINETQILKKSITIFSPFGDIV